MTAGRALLLSFIALTAQAGSPVKKATVLASVYTAPKLSFKLIEGSVRSGDVVECEATTEMQSFGDHADRFVELICPHETRLQRDGVIFGPDKVAVKIEAVQ